MDQVTALAEAPPRRARYLGGKVLLGVAVAWLALMVAATAALVLDCKASAFKPIAALLMPVRSSLIWST